MAVPIVSSKVYVLDDPISGSTKKGTVSNLFVVPKPEVNPIEAISKSIVSIKNKLKELETEEFQEHRAINKLGSVLNQLESLQTFMMPLEKSKETLLNEPELRYMAYYDLLTALPNRQFFTKKLEQALDYEQEKTKGFFVFFIDLDGFKAVNDSHGHDTGDWLLCQVAHRLTHSTRSSDFISRYGGDEFTIISEETYTPEHAATIAERILDVLSAPFKKDGMLFSISASIGISHCPFNGTDPRTLIKLADLAMYKAKSKGKNKFRFFQLDSRL